MGKDCRIGITSGDIKVRYQKLVKAKVVPRGAKLKLVKDDLTHSQAQALENKLIAECNAAGAHCQGAPGGPKKSGPVYSVYRIDW